jgi:hypothetical protein
LDRIKKKIKLYLMSWFSWLLGCFLIHLIKQVSWIIWKIKQF